MCTTINTALPRSCLLLAEKFYAFSDLFFVKRVENGKHGMKLADSKCFVCSLCWVMSSVKEILFVVSHYSENIFFLFLDFIQCSDLWLEVIFTNFKMAGPFWLHTKVYTYFIYSTVYITAIIIWDEAEEIQTYLKIPLTVSIKHIICSYHTIKTFGHSHHNHNKMLLTWSYLKLAFP